MAIWKRLQSIWSARPWSSSNSPNNARPSDTDGAGSVTTPDTAAHDEHRRSAGTATSTDRGDAHLYQAAASLRQLLEDPKIPAAVRSELAEEYRQLESLCHKLTHGDIHIAAFGKVSAGKSSLLNALVGEQRFAVSALHGATQHSQMTTWQRTGQTATTDQNAAAESTATPQPDQYNTQAPQSGSVHLIDTPGINEVAGEERETMAHEVAQRSDLVLFVIDSDLTATELDAIRLLAAEQRPLLLVLNKADRYSADELDELLNALRHKCAGLVHDANIITAAADPRPQTVIRIAEDGSEQTEQRPRQPQLQALTTRLWHILDQEGKSLAALNASLFAGRMGDEVARRMTDVRKQLAAKITRTYCLAKGMAVAVNPIPVADLLAAATLDIVMVRQLSQVYGLPMSRRESSQLLLTIAGQLVALMGAVWGVNLVSSALKGISAGLSTALTAGAQGALAWYATYLIARAAERYLIAGKSWGDGGPKQVVQSIVEDLDRQSILAEAKTEILKRLRAKNA